MREPTPTGDLPAVTVVEISEPTAVSAGIELLDLDAVQLQSLPLRVRREARGTVSGHRAGRITRAAADMRQTDAQTGHTRRTTGRSERERSADRPGI
jgi:hypothetical protein